MLPTAFLCCGKKTLKAEPPGGLAGNAQCRDDCAGAGDGADGDACFGALLHQLFTGVRNGGTARIGNQCAGFACQNAFQYDIALGSLVMLKVADKAFFNTQMVQQLQGYPGVLRGNEIRLLQCFPAADRDITQIANGCGNKIQHASHGCASNR